MKICVTCKENKNEDQFFFRNKSIGTRQYSCKSCWHTKRYERYRKGIKKDRPRIKRRRQELREWVKKIKEKLACSKCGENHPATIQFHHNDPKEKEISLSHAAHRGWSKERIQKEMAKCSILCANCHAKFHYLERV